MAASTNGAMYDFSVLRELRKRDGLSIADVSERSGVSAAVISKMERNRTLAGVDTLYRVARVFGMHASDLLSLAETRSAHKLGTTEHTTNGIRFREVRYGNIRCLLGIAPAGSSVSRPEVHSDDYEVCWVLRGRLMFYLPNEKHEMAAGDAIQFDAILEHTYEAIDDSEFLLVHLRKSKRF